MKQKRYDKNKMTAKPSLFEEVYDVVRHIPKGNVATYGQIAAIIGNVHLSRVVGYALHANPDNGKTPCHRVVFRDGSLADGFAFGGKDVQKEMLEAEGVEFYSDGKVNLEKSIWKREIL